jgi:two-component system NtrC family sensor kinase
MESEALTAGSKPRRDLPARASTIRLLYVLAAAALVFPISLFLIGSWVGYRSTQALANERIERSLDVMEEQALRVFESMNLALDTIANMLDSRTAAEISAESASLHVRLQQIQASLPEVQSIFLFGPDGYPQVITREDP